VKEVEQEEERRGSREDNGEEIKIRGGAEIEGGIGHKQEYPAEEKRWG